MRYVRRTWHSSDVFPENLEKEIEIYYRSLDAADRDEDAEWAELSGSLARETWG